MRRATIIKRLSGAHHQFQSTLSMRRATRDGGQRQLRDLAISIHALHEESDGCLKWLEGDPIISIHALHEESDWDKAGADAAVAFQSTLSMRRATGSNISSLHYF